MLYVKLKRTIIGEIIDEKKKNKRKGKKVNNNYKK